MELTADTKRNPLVSVIVPTRDRPSHLCKALASVFAQSYPGWECLVVNDGGSLPVHMPDDPRFRLLSRETAGGPAAARNTGIVAARGGYVMFLDDDDAYPPGAIECLVREARPGRMVFGQLATVGGHQEIRGQRVWSGDLGGTIIDDPPAHVAGMYPRKSCLSYDEAFRTGEDIEWLFRMGLEHTYVKVPEVSYLNYRHVEERVDVTASTRLKDRERLLDKHRHWFEGHAESHARQLARCASAAHLANKNMLALKLAMRSLARRPTVLGIKLAGASMLGLLGVHRIGKSIVRQSGK